MGARKPESTMFDLCCFDKIINGQHENPTQLLGPHRSGTNGSSQLLIRTFLPTADRAWVTNEKGNIFQEMRQVHSSGLFQFVCNSKLFTSEKERYRIRYAQGSEVMTVYDPYSFEPYFSELDLHLFGEGNHARLYERLGAQPREVDGVKGINFAVWAPNAKGVSLVGSFNDWDGRRHPMKKLIPNGIWELFIPEIGFGHTYKFRVTNAYGQQVDKSDPFGFYSELPPRTASVITDLDIHTWQDDQWLADRAEQNTMDRPISVYEVHLGSWRQQEGNYQGWMNYREVAHQLVEYCLEMNYTHVELMPVSEHPYTGSWGYQTVGYYAATSRYGKPEELMYFVDHCHQNGIGVLIDWVPAHFPKDGHGLARFDGTALYEHSDPRQGYHPDWDTLIFNYDRNEVRNFLISNALFWLEKYHIDGLRVDAVASMLYLDYSREDGQWIPNKYGGRENLGAIDFLKEMNEKVHAQFPGVLTIAEESTAWGGVSRPTYCGGLGFSLKWNMGWMNDTLRYIRNEPIHRKYHHDELTFSLIYAFTENFMLPFSHDEVVHGKGSLLDQMPGDLWQKFANLRLLYAYMWTHPGKKLTFMGNEWGQWNEWNCNSQLQWELLQWDSHKGLQKLVGDLNGLYQREPALYEVDFHSDGFEWIDCMDREASILAYIRRAKNKDNFVVVCCNFTPVVRQNFRLGVPQPGTYREILNSDSQYYNGSNVGNGLAMDAEPIRAQGREMSINITLPPLGACIFKLA
jgi:1,4-alpha-glucan branching enzyme